MKQTKVKKETRLFSAAVGRALRRAAKVARKTARMHGTPIYIWKNGKVVAEKPGGSRLSKPKIPKTALLFLNSSEANREKEQQIFKL